MSKTFNKITNAVHAVLAIIPPTMDTFRLDLGRFRAANKLTSESKQSLRRAIEDILTNIAVNGNAEEADRLGNWTIGELNHPRYLLTRVPASHNMNIVDFDNDGVAVLWSGSRRTEAPLDGWLANTASKPLPRLDQSVSPEAWVEEMLSLRAQALRSDDPDLHAVISQSLVDHGVTVTDVAGGSKWEGQPVAPEAKLEPIVWSYSPAFLKKLKETFTKGQLASLRTTGLVNDQNEVRAGTTIEILKDTLKAMFKASNQEKKVARAALAADKKVVKEQESWLSAKELAIAQKYKLLGRSPNGAAAFNKTDLIGAIQRIKQDPHSPEGKAAAEKANTKGFSKSDIALLDKYGYIGENADTPTLSATALKAALVSIKASQAAAPKKTSRRSVKGAIKVKGNKIAKVDPNASNGVQVGQLDSSIPPGASVAQHYGIGN